MFGDAADDVLEYLGFVICDCARDFSCAVKSFRLCLPQFPTGKVGIKQNILSSLYLSALSTQSKKFRALLLFLLCLLLGSFIFLGILRHFP